MIKIKKCIICGCEKYKKLFEKESVRGELFNLVKCAGCGFEYLDEAPDHDEIGKYYEEYFTRRTDRGYDNYFSDKLRVEIERVIQLNLEDLDFFAFESGLEKHKICLDIGCAAGYFIQYLKKRGWNAYGIDISSECVDYAVKSDLNARAGDYLEADFNERFNLITLWATIEHLHHPEKVLQKAYDELAHKGMLYISTCRIGAWNFMKFFGRNWRFYNFPEHIFFFSYRNIKNLLKKSGFKIVNYRTYGSNIGKKDGAFRKIADFMAKKFYMGDMMLISARKI